MSDVGKTRVEAMAAVQQSQGRARGGDGMSRHSLTIVLLAILLVTLLGSTWFTWVEFTSNEQAGVHSHHPTHIFWAYAAMQIGLNYVAEIMGIVTAVLLTKWFYEEGSKES